MTNLSSESYAAFGTREGVSRIARFLEWLASHRWFEPPVSVLDVGCGPGRMFLAFRALGWQVTSMEPDADFHEAAVDAAAAVGYETPRRGGFRGIACLEVPMKTLWPLLATAFFMLLTVAPASAQAVAGASGAPQITPRVVASWYYERVGDEASQLLFLVLYRGQADWYLRDPALGRHGERASLTSSPDGRTELGPLNIRHVEGGIDLGISVDAAREVMTVLGRELSLAEHNVFLIDRVDGVGGPPEVVAQLSVELDPALDFRLPDSPDVMGIIRRIPDLQAFVSSP